MAVFLSRIVLLAGRNRAMIRSASELLLLGLRRYVAQIGPVADHLRWVARTIPAVLAFSLGGTFDAEDLGSRRTAVGFRHFAPEQHRYAVVHHAGRRENTV
jgi:hypothetical protein